MEGILVTIEVGKRIPKGITVPLQGPIVGLECELTYGNIASQLDEDQCGEGVTTHVQSMTLSQQRIEFAIDEVFGHLEVEQLGDAFLDHTFAVRDAQVPIPEVLRVDVEVGSREGQVTDAEVIAYENGLVEFVPDVLLQPRDQPQRHLVDRVSNLRRLEPQILHVGIIATRTEHLIALLHVLAHQLASRSRRHREFGEVAS